MCSCFRVFAHRIQILLVRIDCDLKSEDALVDMFTDFDSSAVMKSTEAQVSQTDGLGRAPAVVIPAVRCVH